MRRTIVAAVAVLALALGLCTAGHVAVNRAVAEAEGVDVHTVYECLQAVFKKFKKFL